MLQIIYKRNYYSLILSPISPFGQPISPTPSTIKILQTNRRFDKEKYCGKSKKGISSRFVRHPDEVRLDLAVFDKVIDQFLQLSDLAGSADGLSGIFGEQADFDGLLVAWSIFRACTWQLFGPAVS